MTSSRRRARSPRSSRRSPAAIGIHRRVSPGDLGVSALGHFGFFREATGSALWPEVVRFVDAVIAGERPRLPDAPPPTDRLSLVIDAAGLMADLEARRA